MSKNSNSSSGVTFTGLLFLIFLVLKLTKVIAWSWWWITAPLWGHFLIACLIFFIAIAVKVYQEQKYK